MNTQKFSFDTCQIEYIYKNAKKDYKHLLIVFSGYPEKAKYDFLGGASEHYNGNILWIRDACTSSGICNYYMMSDNKYVVEDAVVALINEKINFLNLTNDNVTLIGFSKGGTAALYFGVKYGFKNIVSTVPQIKIGSYVHRYHKLVAREMLGEGYSIDDVEKLDSILSNLIIKDVFVEKNIYIFSSEADEQYKDHVKPYIKIFEKYKNSNIIMADSDFVRKHADVTKYCFNSILSILNALCDGLVPIYENKVSYIKNLPSNLPFEKYVVAKLNKIKKMDGLFFPIGISYINGVESATDGVYKRSVVFENAINRYSFKLGAARNTKASYSEFKGRFIDLSWSGFVPYKNKGISLDVLNKGTYRVLIDVRYNGKTYKGGLSAVKGFKERVFCKDKVISFFCYEDFLYCDVKPISSECESDDVFLSVEHHWIKNNLFHIEGVFHIQGVSYKNYSDVDYFLSIESQSKKEIFRLGMSFRPAIVSERVNSVLPSDKAYYSTLMRKGVDVSCFKGERCKVVIHQYTPDRNLSAEIGYVVI